MERTSKRRIHRSPRFSCWHPLLPAFSARLIIAFRTLLGIAGVAAFTLSPQTSHVIQGQLLFGVSFIVAIKSTLGATIQAARRLYLGGAIAASYCLLIVNFCPPNIYNAIGATTLLVFFIVYTDLPVIVRRFTIVPTCIILLRWFNPVGTTFPDPHLSLNPLLSLNKTLLLNNTSVVKNTYLGTSFVLQIWVSLFTGATLAILVTCIPIPVVPTAYRELTMRMRFVARQTRREISALVLLISEYHNKHLHDGYHNEIKRKKHNSDENDAGIEMPTNSYRDEDTYLHSTSFEDLTDDHLLKSDIEDLHSLVNDELKLMQRALTEIPYEPYFMFLKFLNLMRKCLRHIPFIKKFVRKTSTLPLRLAAWSTSLASMQRTITAMLALEHHHHAFVGQRQLINAICLLLDSSFEFLDATLPYTTAPTSYFNIEYATSCRTKVEEALEHFFETYTQSREDARHKSTSTTDDIHLNTFLLLMLRLVHATITAAETSKTPGARLDSSPDAPPTPPKSKKLCEGLGAYIGIRPSSGKLVRSIKTSLSVLISAIVAFTFRERLQAYGWVYWAPMTTALVSDSSEGGTLRLSFQRLMAVLLGSTYAYVIVLVTQDHIAVGICISIFVGLMGYLKTDPRKEYFASVCGQSASIITFLSNPKGVKQMRASNQAVLARTSLTFLGVFIHVIISNIFLPITARALTKQKVSVMFKNISDALKSSSNDFCLFIGLPTTDQQSKSTNKTSFNLMKTLAETERIADSFPALLEEALNEPNFWKRPFIQVKDRYHDLSKSIRRISADIRFVHRCTTILRAESKLHFAQEAKWLVRRASLAHISNGSDSRTGRTWTMTELRNEKQLQNDLDIPLTIFMTYSPHSTPKFEQKALISNNSSASLRLAHTTLYQPVLEHIRKLENHIQEVISLTGQLIEKQGTVDVGSLELREICREDSTDDQQTGKARTRRVLARDPSFYAVPRTGRHESVTNYYKFCSCCQSSPKDDVPLPSLRNAVDLMHASLIDFLIANNRFMRTEFVLNQSIGDVLAFHTLSYALRDMVEAATNLAKNARRIKHIDTRTLVRAERKEKRPQQTV